MRRTVAVVLAVALSVLGLAGCDRDRPRPVTSSAATSTTTTSKAPVGCTPARPAAAGQSTGTLAFGGLDRSYLLRVPPGYTGTTPVPLVFDFHGHGSSAAIQLFYSAFPAVADREGFVLVAPEGQGSPPHFTLLGATATEADDVEMTVALLDQLSAQLCLDPSRVYATGMSNGGALSSVLACRAPERFAAVAAVAAMVYLPACDQAEPPVPILSMMGTGDPIVPFGGGRVNCCGNPTIRAATDTMASFAHHAGCDAEPGTERLGTTIEVRRFRGCDAGTAVEFYVIEGGGHTWPGSPFDVSGRGLGTTTKDVNATEAIWTFFSSHPRASS